MNLLRRLPILMILLAAACTLGSETPTPSSPALSSETASPTDTPSPTRTFTPSPTLSPIVPIPTIETVTPPVVQYCPDQPEIPLTELGLNPEMYLVVAQNDDIPGDPSENGIFYLTGSDPTLKPIPNTASEGVWNTSLFMVNPRGNWIKYYRWQEGDEHKTIRISTLDGTQQFDIADITFGHSTQWISDEEIVVIGLVNEEDYAFGLFEYWEDLIPLAVIDITTGVIEPLPPLPDNTIFAVFSQLDNNYYAIYYEGYEFDNIQLYDYTNNRSIPIFQWLVDKDWVSYGTTGFRMEDGSLSAFVNRRPYGFDLVVGLDVEGVQQDNRYLEAMTAVVLPGVPNDFRSSSISSLGNSGGNLYVVRDEDMISGKEEKLFYIFDYPNKILRDYCLTFEYGALFKNLSPDGRFLIIVFYSSYGYPPDPKSIILDLDTGYYAMLEDIRVLGLATMPDTSSP